MFLFMCVNCSIIKKTLQTIDWIKRYYFNKWFILHIFYKRKSANVDLAPKWVNKTILNKSILGKKNQCSFAF